MISTQDRLSPINGLSAIMSGGQLGRTNIECKTNGRNIDTQPNLIPDADVIKLQSWIGQKV